MELKKNQHKADFQHVHNDNSNKLIGENFFHKLAQVV